jgi:predicted 2-oxoglutarate/Fe(II)-dependent dioxygenase YbiX
MSIYLEVSDEGGGGTFATWSGDGTRTEHVDLRRGDAVIFPSEKRHGVSPLVADGSVRKSVVLELWERGVTGHNRQR